MSRQYFQRNSFYFILFFQILIIKNPFFKIFPPEKNVHEATFIFPNHLDFYILSCNKYVYILNQKL